MDTKLFELHEAYKKHVLVRDPRLDGLAICCCGCLFANDEMDYLCFSVGDLLRPSSCAEYRIDVIENYLHLLQHAIDNRMRGTDWKYLRGAVIKHIEENKAEANPLGGDTWTPR